MNETKQEQQWIEFSIEVDQDMADLVGNALIGILPAGLVSERVFEEVFPHELDQVSGPIRIFGFYLEEEDPIYRDKILQALNGLKLKVDLPDPSFSLLENKNWTAAWQERYQPIPVGDRLIVVPSWLENPDPERIPIYIDPGMAFGSGTHETTRLSLAMLEVCLTNQIQTELIDVGCGSGILSIAAAKLGVERILGVDTDPEAIRVSKENAKVNHVEKAGTFHRGSVPEILSKKFSLPRAGLVVANIIAPILEELFDEGLGEIVASEGHLVLSGILENQLPAILDHLERNGFEVEKFLRQGEWVAVVAEKIIA
ncbi:MAG: 50S ribosomal protein L11 methyltransferase [Anaerolineales bacterium]|nr:50S ribosomal protein L11 methyltransferase [Anaerolineales bacterium]